MPAPEAPGPRARLGDGQDHEDVRPVTVLLAEDEESFVEALVVGLGREGFEVVVARDGTEALERFDSVSPDVVLLDLMLPKLSGIDVCRAIRARSSVPIIMVTAKATELDTVVGLEVGADDYVTKPYRLRELVARMRAVLRRSPHAPGRPTSQATIPSGEAGALRSGAGAGAGTSTVTGATGTHSSDAGAGVGAGVGAGEAPTHRSGAGAGATGAGAAGAAAGNVTGSRAVAEGGAMESGAGPGTSVLQAGDVQVDPDRHRVFVRGEEVQLRRKEFGLLELLVKNAGLVLTRDVLIERIWGADYVGDTKTLDVHVKRLRSHIEEDPSNPRMITTVRGVGYRFEVQQQPRRDTPGG